MNDYLLDTERSLLALMLDRECRSRARATVKPEWFHRSSHRQMAETALRWDNDHSVELTVFGWATELAKTPGFASVNHAALEISNSLMLSGAPKNFDAYAEIVRESWERREIGRIAQSIHSQSQDQTKSALELASQATSAADIARARISESLTGSEAMLQAALQSAAGSVSTGFVDLDRLLGGMAPGRVITVAGRTGMGKTAFAADVVRNLSRDGVPVGYVTLEMTAAEVHERVMRVPSVLASDPRYWYPSRKVSTDAIAGQGLKWAADGLGLLVVDHLGHVAPQNPRESMYQRTTDNMHDMKRIARTLKCPLMLLVQINRDGADGKPPALTDLRDSGAIEEDSDAVILLHRPWYYDKSQDPSEGWAILAKNRHGRTGAIQVHWDNDRGVYGNAGHHFPEAR